MYDSTSSIHVHACIPFPTHPTIKQEIAVPANAYSIREPMLRKKCC